MRRIDYLVVHCTATQPHASVEAIRRYWREELGWKSPGYHYLIDQWGTIHALHSEELLANGVAGYNAKSIHVSYIGGIDKDGKPKDTRTAAQKDSMVQLLTHLKKKYPKAVIQGHRDFPGVKKACPSFDAKSEYSYL